MNRVEGDIGVKVGDWEGWRVVYIGSGRRGGRWVYIQAVSLIASLGREIYSPKAGTIILRGTEQERTKVSLYSKQKRRRTEMRCIEPTRTRVGRRDIYPSYVA